MERFNQISTEAWIGPLNEIEKKFVPEVLFFAGNKDLANEDRKVSVIGTRNPSNYGIAATRKISKFLVENNITIVSGLAKGVDTISHQIAIENKGKTIAVIGTPLNLFYPAENKHLQEYLMQNQLVISQFKEGSPVLPSNFPSRNRTMALLSQISIIIEAGKKSGTEHQGWEALRLGRQLFILENLVKQKDLVWPQKLIEYGAEVLYLDDLNKILDFLPEKNAGELLYATI